MMILKHLKKAQTQSFCEIIAKRLYPHKRVQGTKGFRKCSYLVHTYSGTLGLKCYNYPDLLLRAKKIFKKKSYFWEVHIDFIHSENVHIKFINIWNSSIKKLFLPGPSVPFQQIFNNKKIFLRSSYQVHIKKKRSY